MALTVVMAWAVIAALLGGVPRGSLPTSLLLVSALALVARRRSDSPQVAAWVGLLAWSMGLLAGSVLALEVLQPVAASAAIALAGSMLIALCGPSERPGSVAILAPAWLAWAQSVLAMPGGQGLSVACFLAVSSLGFMVRALRGRGRWSVAAWAGSAEAALLILIGPGASLAGYLLGTLALSLVILGLLVRAHQVTWLAARQCLAVLTLAAGVAALLTAGWSLLLGRGMGAGWAVSAAALGWLAFPATRRR